MIKCEICKTEIQKEEQVAKIIRCQNIFNEEFSFENLMDNNFHIKCLFNLLDNRQIIKEEQFIEKNDCLFFLKQ